MKTLIKQASAEPRIISGVVAYLPQQASHSACQMHLSPGAAANQLNQATIKIQNLVILCFLVLPMTVLAAGSIPVLLA